MLIPIGTPVKAVRRASIVTYQMGRSVGDYFSPGIPEHGFNKDCEYLKAGHCFYCCQTCNYNNHRCAACGDDLDHNDRLMNGEPNPCYDFEEQDRFFNLLREKGVI